MILLTCPEQIKHTKQGRFLIINNNSTKRRRIVLSE